MLGLSWFWCGLWVLVVVLPVFCGELFGAVADEFGSFGVLVDGHAVFEVVWFGEEAAVFEDVVFDFVSEEAECGFSAPHGDDGEGDLVECLDGCGADGVLGLCGGSNGGYPGFGGGR